MTRSVFLLSLAVLLCAGQARADDGRFKLGVIVPLSGPAASMGQSIQRALMLVEPKRTELFFEDDQCDTKRAVASFHKLSQEGVHVFYLACSGSILALAPVAKQQHALLLTGYAGSAAIRKTGSEVIRFNPDAISVAEALLSFLKKRTDLKRLALLHEDQDYAESLAALLEQELGPRLAARESYLVNQPDYQAQLLKLSRSKPDALVLIPVSDVSAEVVFKNLRDGRYPWPIIGEVNLCDYKVKPSQFNLRGFCFSAQMQGKSYEQFVSSFRERFSEPPQYPFYDAVTYDVLYILERLQESGKIDPSTPVETIASTILKGVEGRISSYSFTPDGEVVAGERYLHEAEF